MRTPTERVAVSLGRERVSFWLGGIRYTFIATSKETQGRFALYESFIPPGHGARAHVHSREAESFWILAGTLDVALPDKDLVLHGGDFVCFPPGVVYSFQNNTAEAVRMLTVLVPGGLEEFLAQWGDERKASANGPAVSQESFERMIAGARLFGVEYPRTGPNDRESS